MKLPSGSITNRNAGAVLAAGAAAIRGGDCTMDFSDVQRCDTAALACVLAWMRLAQAGGRHLHLVAVPGDLLSLARLCGVEALVAGAGAVAGA